MTDRSNGYEGISAEFLAGRGSVNSSGVGARAVREWACTLPPAAAVLELGCGSGLPITTVVVAAGHSVYGIDAAPSMVEAFQRNFPNVPVACETVEDSLFFSRTFDAVLAWGLIFLLPEDAQRKLISKIGDVLVPGGRVLFTAGPDPQVWNDAMTGLESRTFSATEYRKELYAAGMSIIREYDDQSNYYFDAIKKR